MYFYGIVAPCVINASCY